MPKLQLKKAQGRSGVGFVPANKASEVEAEGFPMGRVLRAEITTPRSIKHNGLMFQFFTLLAKVLNSGPGEKHWDQNSIRKRLLIMTGNADVCDLPGAVRDLYGIPRADAVVSFEPRSMAFESMDQNEASKFFNLAIAYVLNEFGAWVQDHPDWIEVRNIIQHATQGQAT